MQSVQNNASHMVMGVVAIIAVTILAFQHIISGGEALGAITMATGFTMGVSGSSVSGGVAAAIAPSTSVPPGQSLKETVSHEVTAASTDQPAA